MRLQRFVLSIPFVSSLSSVGAVGPDDDNVYNANHIFNAIHSSMRQWGSSLNHNGMSFFVATVQEGTQLYHGTVKREPVEGMEWLAFEPEHALVFARSRGPPPEDGEHGRPSEGGEMEVEHDDNDDDGDRDQWEDYPPHSGYHHGPPAGSLRHHPHEAPVEHYPSPPSHHKQHDYPLHFNHGPSPPRYSHELPPPPPSSRLHERPPPLPDHRNPIREHPHRRQHTQQLLSTSPQTGCLHTYTPTHPLTLLYIDGMSAGKTSNGTLDSQDRLLLNLTSSSTPHSGHDGMFLERARAEGLCNLTRTLWKGKLDGIIRMEGGFEMILCDFSAHLAVQSIITVGAGADVGAPGRGGVMGGWEYMKAVASRYHGIGGARVELAYDDFVSVFAYEGLELWGDESGVSDTVHPRLGSVDDAKLRGIRDAVTAMVLRHSEEKRKNGSRRDWQLVADMLVLRYSAPLHHLHRDEEVRGSKDAFARYIAGLMRAFIDPAERNATRESQRCIAQHVPAFPHPPSAGASASASLAHRVSHSIAARICTTLLTSLSAVQQSASHSSPASAPPAHALAAIDDLVAYLQWTSWKECGPCGDEKVCMIPIWPWGTLEDHRQPRCRGGGTTGESVLGMGKKEEEPKVKGMKGMAMTMRGA